MKTKILDYIGISAAVACLIHCILFPLLMIIPIGISHNPYIDLVFLLIGATVVYRVTKRISSFWLKALFWASISLISISVGLDFIFHIHSELIFAGAAGLITAHFINFKKHNH
ncbi:MerC mercury resistance protein [Chryseobacterium taeanense]|uniref:MerC mercury resistance protein n=1 Tax=Chryseobacterium taeanense TaxID=311334 RepID=A0A1G8L7T5_9FLAO|nr:MerC domain-containing protein [Chryseobacterium taeanense]SDI51759.1 MerC mercury resistance protein [Chryseobacterium taeanense]